MNRVHGQEEQARRYSAQLADNEAQFSKLRNQSRDIAKRQSALEAELKSSIAALNF
ncbi:MAG: hypothetical protein JO138_08855 [Acidobacteriaceae bacterium]|nr:hypothetical protein [Acidobacteriaceae bacterium]